MQIRWLQNTVNELLLPFTQHNTWFISETISVSLRHLTLHIKGQLFGLKFVMYFSNF